MTSFVVSAIFTIVGSVPAGDLTYSWTVPDDAGTQEGLPQPRGTDAHGATTLTPRL